MIVLIDCYRLEEEEHLEQEMLEREIDLLIACYTGMLEEDLELEMSELEID